MAVAVNIELPTKIVMRIVDKDTAVPLGTVMKLNDENTVTVTAADGDPFGGICTYEKLATDTDITLIPCAMDGVWDIDTNGAITAGEEVAIHGANMVSVTDGTADMILGAQVGQAEETADGVGGKIQVRVRG